MSLVVAPSEFSTVEGSLTEWVTSEPQFDEYVDSPECRSEDVEWDDPGDDEDDDEDWDDEDLEDDDEDDDSGDNW